MMFQPVWCLIIAVELCMLAVAFSQTLYNSTLACTRGAGQTDFVLDCRDVYPDGATRVLSFSRVFFGATPSTSGCSRTAPYANCCAPDTNTPGCTFPVDAELQEIVDKCSGANYCSFSGKRLSTSLGNCDQNIYPSLTSFSFVEYNCTDYVPASTSTATTTVLATVRSSSTSNVTITPTSETSFNSSLACTRGAQQTYHDLDCRDHYQDGSNRSLSIVRVFYGTTPLSSGCSRTAPYANCCVPDPNKADCVFQNDAELQDIIEKCSGVSYCAFPGLRVSSSLGNCDANNYPSLTSFSFIEFQCLSRRVTGHICSDIVDQQVGQVYLESNTVLVGRTVINTTCHCLITTDCESSLNFYGIIVQLTQVNATCVEEITFADVRYPQLTARVTCADDDNVLYNQSLFTSLSNVASFHFRVSGQQQGKIYIRVTSSVSTANVTLTCGTPVAQALSQIQQCPNQTTTTRSPNTATAVRYYTSSSTTSSTATSGFSTSSNSTTARYTPTTQYPSTTNYSSTTQHQSTMNYSSTSEYPSTPQHQSTMNYSSISEYPSTPQYTSTVSIAVEGSILISSVACTRGVQQTNHSLDCREHYQDGSNRSLSIIRVFYGTTPLSSGCNRTAPYANCCARDPNKTDCVFQNDAELQEIIQKCSGVSYCAFPGLSVSSTLGNCDANNYPSLTSFSFIEFQCFPELNTGGLVSSTLTSTLTTQDVTNASTTSSVMPTNQATPLGDASSSAVGVVQNFQAGSIIGIVFGVLGTAIVVFIVILLVMKYRSGHASSSRRDIAIMPDGTIVNPSSRLWVKDKWSKSL